MQRARSGKPQDDHDWFADFADEGAAAEERGTIIQFNPSAVRAPAVPEDVWPRQQLESSRWRLQLAAVIVLGVIVVLSAVVVESRFVDRFDDTPWVPPAKVEPVDQASSWPVDLPSGSAVSRAAVSAGKPDQRSAARPVPQPGRASAAAAGAPAANAAAPAAQVAPDVPRPPAREYSSVPQTSESASYVLPVSSSATLLAGPPLTVAPPSPPAPSDQSVVETVLGRYRDGYSKLNASYVETVWPSVNVAALSRAFEQLESQFLAFDDCKISIDGSRARAVCLGTASFTTKVGSRRERTEERLWTFQLYRANDRWIIDKAESRKR